MTNQPAVEAELRSLLGKLYEQIGNYRRAEEMERDAVAINRQYYGVESRQAATSLNDLALELMAQHRLPEAEAADRESARHPAAGGARARKMPTRPSFASMTWAPCIGKKKAGYAEAEAMAREALGIRRRVLPEAKIWMRGRFTP